VKLATLGWGVLGLLVLAAALEWHGHHRGYDDGVQATQAAAKKQVDAAVADRQLAEAQRAADALTLATVRRELKTLKDGLEAQRAISQAALDARDQLQNKLGKLLVQRTVEAQRAAHEDPQCADLARLPVCPAVAGQLWGPAASDQAGTSH